MRTAVSQLYRVALAVSVTFAEISEAFALDGYYMGQWAPDKEACDTVGSQNRLVLEQTDLKFPQLHCKLMGLRQDDESGTIFMASCNDASTSWNDEIALKANKTRLSLEMKSDGQRRQFLRCSQSATTSPKN